MPMPKKPMKTSKERHKNPFQGAPTCMEELLEDFMRMKAVMRQHERRIRALEEELAERNMSQAYGF